jgi:fumarate reductase flavoprotein subunit
MKVFNRRNVLKGGLVGSMAAGFASFVGASHAAEPAAKAPAQNDKNTYDVIVLGAGPAGLVTAIAAKQAGAKKVVVFEKRDRPDGKKNKKNLLGTLAGFPTRINGCFHNHLKPRCR